jgi:hypothetical protein
MIYKGALAKTHRHLHMELKDVDDIDVTNVRGLFRRNGLKVGGGRTLESILLVWISLTCIIWKN